MQAPKVDVERDLTRSTVTFVTKLNVKMNTQRWLGDLELGALSTIHGLKTVIKTTVYHQYKRDSKIGRITHRFRLRSISTLSPAELHLINCHSTRKRSKIYSNQTSSTKKEME